MKSMFFLFFIIFHVSLADYKRLRCLVCRSTVEEMVNDIDKVDPKKKIQVGGYRLDDSGNVGEKLIPFARSGMHLSELMDNVCQKMEDYVKATDKVTKKLMILKLITDSGAMNPKLGEVDVVQDSDLNKSLQFYCEGIVEEFEDEIYNGLKEPLPDPITEICTKATNLCENFDKDEL